MLIIEPLGTFEACSVDESHWYVKKVGCDALSAVTSETWHTVCQGDLLAQQTIEKSWFANVGSAYDGYSVDLIF